MFDFDKVIPRRGTGCLKWDAVPEGFSREEMKDVIPMWVADMDFQAAPCVREALSRKLNHGIFGYSCLPDSYFDAETDWFSRRHGWTIQREWITPIGGLVPAATVAIKSLTEPGDEVIVQVPAYNCFFRNVTEAGCVLSENRLIYKDGAYTIDFDDFERRCKTARVFLLCNPHNPTGRLWTEKELTIMGDICLKYGVKVISDEIHCDIVPPGSSYVPFASIKPEFEANCVAFNSPTKCFNLAGLLISNIVTANPDLKARIDRTMREWEHSGINQIGWTALQAAFSPEGEAWLDEMNEYVHGNYLRLKQRFAEALPELPVCKLEATYLVWVDCSALPIDTKTLETNLIRNQKVWINSGRMYGDDRFIRINIAYPRQILDEGIERIIRGIR